MDIIIGNLNKDQSSIWTDGYDSAIAGKPLSSCRRLKDEDRQVWEHGYRYANSLVSEVWVNTIVSNLG